MSSKEKDYINLTKGDYFVTWNIETPFYCNEDHHPRNEKNHLNNEVRWNKIKDKIINEINCESIICLQEVCREWCCKLYKIFNDKNYTLISSLYGTKKNGYMGICIAFPNKYSILDCKIERVSELYKLPEKINDNYYDIHYNYFWGLLGYKTEDYMDIVKSRSNTVIALKLENKNNNSSFWVLNYHMPCIWRNPIILAIYCIIIQKFVRKISNNGDIPCIILGDFNSQPSSVQYEIMTNYSFDSIKNVLGDYPDFIKDEEFINFISVYKEKFNNEPICTNYAYCEKNGIFKGTLDYIFVTPNITVLDVDELFDQKYFLPNEWPSDHLMIKAKLKIKDFYHLKN